MKHTIIRTSPKGEKFIGYCCLCGKENLSLSDMSECENVINATNQDALLLALKGGKQ